MARAIWKNTVLAESNDFKVIEGNLYFPPESLKKEYFKESDLHSTCPWKGYASYYTLVVDGQENKDAAWYYPSPKQAAAEIRNYVAFWHGVNIEK